MFIYKSIFAAILISITCLGVRVDAQVPHLLNYQGRLAENGVPFDGTAEITFSFYDASSGGTAIWSETHNIEVQNGIFNVLLGSGEEIPDNLFLENNELYLGISVNDNNEFEPRSRVSSVAYASRSNSAATVDNGAITSQKLAGDIDITTTGNVEASSFTGDGSGLTGIVADQIADGAVGTQELANNAVTASKISSGAVTAGKIGTFAVTNAKIASGAVSAAKLASNISITTTGNFISTDGRMDIRKGNNMRVRAWESISGAGFFQSYGSNGNPNVTISNLSGNANHGWLGVYDANNNFKARVYVNSNGNGVVTADVKSFVVQSSSNPNTEIWYASLEGPEAGAYFRGTARLSGGEGVITVPQHFIDIAVTEGITVQVTPLSSESLGLAVVDKSLETGIVVKELHNGNGSYEFDFTVKAVRKGFEDWQVIRESSSDFESTMIEDLEIDN